MTHVNAHVIQLRPRPEQAGNVESPVDAEGAEVVADDDVTESGEQPELAGDAHAAPQPEPAAPSPGEHDSAAGIAGDAAAPEVDAARHRSLELVSAAVELADRIERDANDAVAERIARADEDVRRRMHEIEQYELELERRGHEIQQQQQYAAEAARAAQSLVEHAEQEAAARLRQAGEEADAIVEKAHADADEVGLAKLREFEEALQQVRAAHSAAREPQPKRVDDSRVDDQGRVEDQSPPPVAPTPAVAPPPTFTPPPTFAPPPLSPEDLAEGSTVPRFARTFHLNSAPPEPGSPA